MFMSIHSCFHSYISTHIYWYIPWRWASCTAACPYIVLYHISFRRGGLGSYAHVQPAAGIFRAALPAPFRRPYRLFAALPPAPWSRRSTPMCVCVCACIFMHLCVLIYIYKYWQHLFQLFEVSALHLYIYMCMDISIHVLYVYEYINTCSTSSNSLKLPLHT